MDYYYCLTLEPDSNFNANLQKTLNRFSIYGRISPIIPLRLFSNNISPNEISTCWNNISFSNYCTYDGIGYFRISSPKMENCDISKVFNIPETGLIVSLQDDSNLDKEIIDLGCVPNPLLSLYKIGVKGKKSLSFEKIWSRKCKKN